MKSLPRSGGLALLLALVVGGCALPAAAPRGTAPSVAPPAAPAAVAAPEPASPALDSQQSKSSLALYYYGLANLSGSENDLDAAIKYLLDARRYDPDSSYLTLALAEVYLRQGEDDKALQALSAALATDPESLEAHTLLGRIYFGRQDYAAATKAFRDAVALAPDDEDLMLQLVVSLANADDTRGAEATLKDFIDHHPEAVKSRLALGRLYQETGQPAQAEATYKQLVKDHPDLREARLDLARFYESRPEDLDRAVAIYRQLLTEDPGDARLRNHLAAVLITAGKLDAARDELEALLQFHPDDLEARRKLGLIAIEQEHWPKAVELFQGILDQRPDSAQVRYYLGVALERQGDLPGALDAFSRVAVDSPFGDDALMHRAYLLDTMKHRDQAIALLEKRLEGKVDRADIYIYLASLYAAQGHEQLALDRVAAGLKAFPDNIQLHYQRGVLLEKIGEHDQAAAEMAAILKLDPDFAEALNYLAYRWAERDENLQQALDYARRALKKSDQPHIRDTLGWVLYRLGDYDQALKELQGAAEGLPGDPVVLGHLADVCQAAGLHDLAVLYYRRLLKKEPDNKVLREKLQKSLEELKK